VTAFLSNVVRSELLDQDRQTDDDDDDDDEDALAFFVALFLLPGVGRLVHNFELAARLWLWPCVFVRSSWLRTGGRTVARCGRRRTRTPPHPPANKCHAARIRADDARLRGGSRRAFVRFRLALSITRGGRAATAISAAAAAAAVLLRIWRPTRALGRRRALQEEGRRRPRRSRRWPSTK
jgi:hypothetical protein